MHAGLQSMSQWLSPDTTFSSSPSMSKEGITPGRPPGFLAPWLLLAAEVDLQHVRVQAGTGHPRRRRFRPS
jgi:hypothetical protein